MDVDIEMLLKNLRLVKNECLQYDANNAASAALGEIVKLKLPSELRQSIGIIGELIIRGDFEEASTLAEEIIVSLS